MYCRSCKTDLADGAVACTGCGKAPLNGAAYCFKCGADTDPEAVMCVKCGASLGGLHTGSLDLSASGIKANRVLIGVIAIMLGSLGIHKFLLGYTQEGIIMLVVTLASRILMSIVPFFLFSMIGAFAPSVMAVIGVVEGIIYLTKTDQQFYETYVANKRAWF